MNKDKMSTAELHNNLKNGPIEFHVTGPHFGRLWVFDAGITWVTEGKSQPDKAEMTWEKLNELWKKTYPSR